MEVSPQVVTNWKSRGVPLDRCADIERVTAGAVTRADFYPEHFGPIETRAA
jgi:DNA-binding transcriptional regulator YdaS (Cro superfamily)